MSLFSRVICNTLQPETSLMINFTSYTHPDGKKSTFFEC
jgi:hypothetical protein